MPSVSAIPSGEPSMFPTGSTAPSDTPSCLVEETVFLGGAEAQCNLGPFGVSSVEVLLQSDSTVEFSLINGLGLDIDYFFVFYDTVGGLANDTCHFYDSITSDGARMPTGTDVFTAQCIDGSATISILARNGDPATNQTAFNDAPEPDCNNDPLLDNAMPFNAFSDCYFELTVPCRSLCSRRLLTPEETEETVELLVEEKSEETVELVVQVEEKSEKAVEVVVEDKSEEVIACEEKSKSEGIHTIKVDECIAAPHENPVQILSQDVDTVKFEVRQVWKGCEAGGTLSWVATDYINEDGDLTCVKESNMECGGKTTYTAHCTEGVAVVDLYTFDEERGIFGQADGSQMVTPLVCDAHGDPAKTCHFRYALQCAPASCNDANEDGAHADESMTNKLMGMFANLF